MMHMMQHEMDATQLSLNRPHIGPDRSNSFTPDSVIPSDEQGLIVIVDPISTGACLAHHLTGLTHDRLVRVWSSVCPDVVKNHTKKGLEVSYCADMQCDDVATTVAALRKLGPVEHVMVGCETGVLCADMLAHALGVDNNGVALSTLRRNKFEQIEAVRAAGLDAPLQKLATNAADVEEWLASEAFPTPFKAVVKPVEGAGSDGVSICDSPDEVRAAYAGLEGTSNVLGLLNREVLLQEFLRGDEYVVDTATRDGVHKVVAIWKYDKREANGSPIVYFGMRLLSIEDEPELAEMCRYVNGVLDALGIRWGACHSEVKLESRGPVLVEVNCRLHGGEGIWLSIPETCLGYTQVTAMADAYLHPASFGVIPSVPRLTLAHGAWVTIRSGKTGTVRGIDDARLAQIRALPSYIDEYLGKGVGDTVVTTVDACTFHGCFNLSHSDAEQLRRDYDHAQALVDAGIYILNDEEVGAAGIE